MNPSNWAENWNSNFKDKYVAHPGHTHRPRADKNQCPLAMGAAVSRCAKCLLRIAECRISHIIINYYEFADLKFGIFLVVVVDVVGWWWCLFVFVSSFDLVHHDSMINGSCVRPKPEKQILSDCKLPKPMMKETIAVWRYLFLCYAFNSLCYLDGASASQLCMLCQRKRKKNVRLFSYLVISSQFDGEAKRRWRNNELAFIMQSLIT